MAFNWYSRDLDKAHPGQIADTTNHILDSFSAALAAGVEPGTPVIRGAVEGTVQNPASDADAAKIIGVAVHKHKEPTVPYYEKGDTLPVMTLGDVFVQVNQAITAPDTDAAVIKSGDSYVFCPSTLTSAIAMTDAKFLDTAEAGGLVRLRIRK